GGLDHHHAEGQKSDHAKRENVAILKAVDRGVHTCWLSDVSRLGHYFLLLLRRDNARRPRLLPVAARPGDAAIVDEAVSAPRRGGRRSGLRAGGGARVVERPGLVHVGGALLGGR